MTRRPSSSVTAKSRCGMAHLPPALDRADLLGLHMPRPISLTRASPRYLHDLLVRPAHLTGLHRRSTRRTPAPLTPNTLPAQPQPYARSRTARRSSRLTRRRSAMFSSRPTDESSSRDSRSSRRCPAQARSRGRGVAEPRRRERLGGHASDHAVADREIVFGTFNLLGLRFATAAVAEVTRQRRRSGAAGAAGEPLTAGGGELP